MTALSDTINALFAPGSTEVATIGDLRLIAYPNNRVLSVNTVPRTRDLTNDDLDTVRAALTDAGYREVASWVATQGVSWMSDGVFAGVSIEVEKVARPLVSDATIAEVAAMEARDRAAGGPPWEVADHPENFQPGGWHHGQITGTPAPGWS